MKTIFLLLLVFASHTLFSQAPSKHRLFLDAGYSFNSDIKLAERPIQGSRANTVTIGATYRLFKHKKFHTELGLAAKIIYSWGRIDDRSFDATTLRVGMPLNFVYSFSEKWSASAGFFLQNNVDLSDFDLRLRDKYSWRLNFVPEVRYAANANWAFSLKGHFNTRDMADAYVINDPKIGFSFGVARYLFGKM